MAEALTSPTRHVTDAWPPGPVGDPAGAATAFATDPLGVQLEWWHTYGDIWTVELPFGRMVFVAHPDLVHQLTRTTSHGDTTKALTPVAGRSLITEEGDEWRRLRRLMQPMFGRPVLRALVPGMVEAIERRLDELDLVAESGETIDLARFLGGTTLRVLLHTMLSDEFSEAETDLIVDRLYDVAAYKGALLKKDFLPPGVPVPHRAEGEAAMAEIDPLLYDAIARRRAIGNVGTDLLGRLLEASDDDGTGLSDEEVRNNLYVLLFGGWDTSQWALAWALAFLADSPDAYASLLAEADALPPRPTGESLTELGYAEAALNEALRKQSIIFLPRCLDEDQVFGGYRIPKGTRVCASAVVVHNRPDFWTDPDAFRPERFLGMEAAEQHKYQLISFGGGPRVCIGINLAYFENQLILAMMLRRFTYAIAPGWQRRHKHEFAMVLDGGLPVTIQRRSQP